MSKGTRIIVLILGFFLTITSLHLWLNVGLDKLGFSSGDGHAQFRVGYLPVT